MSDKVEFVGIPPENAPEPGQLADAYSWLGIACLIIGGIFIGWLFGSRKQADNVRLVAENKKLQDKLGNHSKALAENNAKWQERFDEFNAQAESVAKDSEQLAEENAVIQAELDTVRNLNKESLEVLKSSKVEVDELKSQLKDASVSASAKQLAELDKFKERWAQTSNTWRKTIDSKVRRARS